MRRVPVPTTQPKEPFMTLPSRRPLQVLLLLALVLGVLAGPAATASSADPGDRAAETVSWLQRRVASTGLVTGPARHERVKVRKGPGRKARWVRRTQPGPAYAGLSIEVLTALRRLDPGGRTQADVVRALEGPAERYVGFDYGVLSGRYVEATARLLHVVATSSVPVREFADGSLKRSLVAMVRKRRGDPQRGRAVDSGWGGDTSSTVSQAAAVQALAAVDSRYLPMAARFLAKQSCTNGHFRQQMDSPDYTCKGSTQGRNRVGGVESTASAVIALVAARRAGVRGLDDEIGLGARWLGRRVARNGSVAEDEVADVRATAMAALALKAAGKPGPAGNAAAWLLRLQVDKPMVQRHRALRGQRGAIAWDRRTLQRAQRDGIGRAERKRWTRSTAIGASGLSVLLPERRLEVRAANRRKQLAVRVLGLVAGERYVLRRNGRLVAQGRVPADGKVVVSLGKARADTRLVVRGSHPGRSGVTVVSPR